MGAEINIDSILVLEKRIEEGLGDLIQLKRARNSLLNISTLMPPELLGQVFCWNVVPIGDYGDIRKGSYNFLLVCHYWYKVASGTTELWTYWGNSLKQWSRRYQRSGTAPLDLVLRTRPVGGNNPTPFDGPLRDALRDRAACGSVRSVRLQGSDVDLLQSIVSSLTPNGEGVRDSSVDSLILEYTNLDISKFLARHRFPKPRILHLSTGAKVTSWDHLKIQATSLTSLSLELPRATGGPTTSQLLSILASYPNLQDLSLCEAMIPNDVGDGSTFRVPLCRLRGLRLTGDCRHVFRLLQRLEYPDKLEWVYLHLKGCKGTVDSEFLEPYLRDRIRRDGRFWGRLGIQTSCTDDSISFCIGVLDELDTMTMLPGFGYPSVSFWAVFRGVLPQVTGEKIHSNLIAAAPREHVVHFMGEPSTNAMRDLFVTMPNIDNLLLMESVVSDAFLRPDPLSHTKLLPSLRHLCLDSFTLQNHDDWGPLIAYLAYRSSHFSQSPWQPSPCSPGGG